MNIKNPITGRPFGPRLTIPEIFGQALSYEDQILMLVNWVTEAIANIGYVSKDDLTALDERLTAAIKAVQAGAASDLQSAVSDLEYQISQISEGQQIWDVTRGAYGAGKPVIRKTVWFVVVHAITCEQLGRMEITVQQLADSGINCHGLAVLGLWLVDKGYTLPERFTPYSAPRDAASLTTSDLMNLQITQDLFVKSKG